MPVSSNPPWGKEPVQHCDRFYKACSGFCLLICVHVAPFLCRRMERKVHCLVTAGKGVQGIHQCHLEQALPLANALSDSASPCFSTGIRFLLPTNRLLKPCFSGGRTLSAGSTQTLANPTATFSFPRERQRVAPPAQSCWAPSLLSLTSPSVQSTPWQATLAEYVQKPTITV